MSSISIDMARGASSLGIPVKADSVSAIFLPLDVYYVDFLESFDKAEPQSFVDVHSLA